MTKKRVPAPEWFVELWESAKEQDAHIAKLINVSVEWMRQAKNPTVVSDMLIKLPHAQKLKALRILDYVNASKDYCWSRFRLENEDYDIANAENLTYLADEKVIEARSGLIKSLIESFKKVGREFGLPDGAVKVGHDHDRTI